MCNYRTCKDGRLFTYNVEAEKVELLYEIKTTLWNITVPEKLRAFIDEAENALFEAQGSQFKEWLKCVSPAKTEELLTLQELHCARDGVEYSYKQFILQLLKRFLTL